MSRAKMFDWFLKLLIAVLLTTAVILIHRVGTAAEECESKVCPEEMAPVYIHEKCLCVIKARDK